MSPWEVVTKAVSTLDGEKPLDVVISHSHHKNAVLMENSSLVVMDFWMGIG